MPVEALVADVDVELVLTDELVSEMEVEFVVEEVEFVCEMDVELELVEVELVPT